MPLSKGPWHETIEKLSEGYVHRVWDQHGNLIAELYGPFAPSNATSIALLPALVEFVEVCAMGGYGTEPELWERATALLARLPRDGA